MIWSNLFLSFTNTFVKILKLDSPDFPQSLVRVALRAFEKLLDVFDGEEERDIEDEEMEPLINRQDDLNRVGMTDLVLHLITHGSSEVVKGSLNLGISLLYGGNKTVQDTIYELFLSNSDGEFFLAIRSRIRRSMLEIKEKQLASKQEKSAIAQETFVESGHILPLLRFLQLLCEGHNNQLQNYLRSQTQNVKSFDLVSETAAYLGAVHREINPSNIDAAIQTYETLAEFCQGPCTDNQQALIRTKLCQSTNHLLNAEFKSCSRESVSLLKEAAVGTLLSLLEGNLSPSISRQMIATLDFRAIRVNMDACFTTAQQEAKSIQAQNTGWMHKLLHFGKTKKTDDKVQAPYESLEPAYLYYFLFCNLVDYDTGDRLKSILRESPNHNILNEGTGRIELVRDGRLERVYFRIPPKSNLLPRESKDELLWSIDRDNQQDKMKDFLERSEALMQEVQHRKSLLKDEKFSLLHYYKNYIDDISFALAIFINFLIIWYFQGTVQEDGILSPPHAPFLVRACISLLGVVHSFCAILLFFVYAKFNAALVVKRQWIQRKSDDAPEEDEDDGAAQNMLSISRTRFYWNSAGFLLRDWAFVFHLLYVIFSLAGTCLTMTTNVGPFFFSFHLLGVITRSSLLKYVIKSVTQNGRSILLTVVLALVIIYIYAIFGFIFFRNKFTIGDDEDFHCSSMFECLLTVVNYGLRSGGGIGDILLPPSFAEQGSLLRVTYDSTFFFVVIILLLNIIFGIIIDTFGELRTLNNEIEDDIKNKCFICGIDRSTFERQAQGFVHHTKKEHCLWHYLYFIMELRDKSSTDYTGPEQYVDDMLKAGDHSFIPNMKAMCLSEREEEKERKARLAEERLQKLTTLMQDNFQTLTTALEDLQSQINALRETQSRPRRSLQSGSK